MEEIQIYILWLYCISSEVQEKLAWEFLEYTDIVFKIAQEQVYTKDYHFVETIVYLPYYE